MRTYNLRLAENSCVFLWALVLEHPPNKSQNPHINHADQCLPTVCPQGEKSVLYFFLCKSFFFFVVPFWL